MRCDRCSKTIWEVPPSRYGAKAHKIVTADTVEFYCSECCPGRLGLADCGNRHDVAGAVVRHARTEQRLNGAMRVAKLHDRRKAAGLCPQCGQPNDRPGRWRCLACHAEYLSHQRKRQGVKPWGLTGKGRPPIVKAPETAIGGTI
jgi:hypothetical protein